MSTSAWTPVDESKWKPVPDEDAPPPVPKAPIPAGLQGPPNQSKGPGLLGTDFHQPVHSLNDLGEEAYRGLSNIGASGLGLYHQVASDPLGAVSNVFRHSVPGMALEGGLTGKTIFNTETPETAKGLIQHPLETGEGLIGQMGAGGIAGEAARGVSKLVTPYRSPIVPTAETHAENLMKAIMPPEGVTPGGVKSVMREAPHIREYAQRTGNPLKTVPEGKYAAQGVAEEGFNNYKQKFLGPNANERVTLENNMSPDLGHSATLGEIEKQISDLNDQIRNPSAVSKSTGQLMTAMEKTGAEAELKGLRGKLYGTLAEKTGYTPEDIQAMREGYGGQFTLKNALESGHANRLTSEGRSSQGGGSFPTGKASLIDRVVQKIPGMNPTAVANRQFAKRIQAFDPEAPKYLQPNPPRQTPFMGAPVNPEVEGRIGAIGSDAGVQPTAPKPKPTLTGPMAKAPAVAEAEGTSKLLQDEKNAAYRSKQAPPPRPQKPEGLGPTQPPQAQVIPPPENYTRTVLEGAKRRSVPEPVPKPNVLDRLLGPAREGQEQARLLRKGKQQ